MTEKEIIDGCRIKDPDSQRELYESLAPAMFGVCMRYVGDRAVAEDLLHDGFVTIFTKIGEYRGEGSFQGWCRRIFVNTALGYLRRSSNVMATEDVEDMKGIMSQNTDAVEQMSGRELLELISKLSDGYRTVINLYAVEGYSHKEIGEMLGISENTSRSQYSRARQRLMEILENEI